MGDRKRQASKDSSELRENTTGRPLKQTTLTVITSKPPVEPPTNTAMTEPQLSVPNVSLKQGVKDALLDDEIKDFFANLFKTLISAQVEVIETRFKEALSARDRELDELRQETTAMKNQFERKIESLEASLEKQQAYGRRNSLIINGYDEVDEEDTDDIILSLAKFMKVDIQSSDISRSHRLGKRSNSKPRSIIVKFVSFNARSRFIMNRRALKYYNHPNKLFINENLTPKRANIYKKCRDMVKKKQISSCWTFVGSVYIKREDDSVTCVDNGTALLEELCVSRPV